MNYTKPLDFSEIRVCFYITEKRQSVFIKHCASAADKSVIVPVKSYISTFNLQHINSAFCQSIINCVVGGNCAVFAYNSRRASSVALLYINNFNAVFLAIIFYGNIYNIFPAV